MVVCRQLPSDPPPWVNKYIHIPYVDYRGDFQGADCWGIIDLVYRNEAGIELPRYDEHGLLSWYAKEDRRVIAETMTKYSQVPPWRRIPDDEEPKLWDVLWFKAAGNPVHMGLTVARGVVLHSDTNLMESCLSQYKYIGFGYKLLGAYRHEAFDV